MSLIFTIPPELHKIISFIDEETELRELKWLVEIDKWQSWDFDLSLPTPERGPKNKPSELADSATWMK